MKRIIFILLLGVTVLFMLITKISKSEANIPNGVITNNYKDNGINIRVNILNVNSPFLLVESSKLQKEYKFTKIYDNEYEVNLDFTQLKNGKYKLYIKEKNDVALLKNELDILERLVRAKINDKLVTFNYADSVMSMEISDFEYEYDIFIDPGHGGEDQGASNGIINEASLNLEQSLYEKSRYESHGLKVLLARTDDGIGINYKSADISAVRQRAYSLGYFGVVSRVVYSNHHNSTVSKKSGFEILVSNRLTDLSLEKNIIENVNKIYPDNIQNKGYIMYSRDYETGAIFNKIDSKIYEYRDYYATIRIPDELYNIKTVTYEGCYLSNKNDFNWCYYDEGWKQVSEVKIKAYVESLGKEYIPL